MIKKHLIASILTFLCVIAFLSHIEILQLIYPGASADYDVFIEFYYTKIKFDECMYAALFFIIFIIGKKWIRAFGIAGFILVFGSVLDKIIFGVHTYIWTDVILLIVAIRTAWVVKSEKHA